MCIGRNIEMEALNTVAKVVVHGKSGHRRCEVMLHLDGNGCRLNRSMQHFVEVYWREFEILRFFLDADLIAAPLGPGPLGCNPTGRFSEGSIVVIAHFCFRSSRAARDSADRRNKLSPPSPW